MLFRPFCPVSGTRGATLFEPGGVELATHDRVLHADVLDPPTTKQNDRVLLQIVAHARNVGGNLHPVGESNTGDLTDSRVRFPRSLRSHFRTHATLEGGRIKSWSVLECIKTTSERGLTRLRRFVFTTSLGELIDGGHLEKEDPRGSRTI